ncbi:MAG: DNA adenine methylase [bacterium]|nr:DNA adenine methylase [bacterium]
MSRPQKLYEPLPYSFGEVLESVADENRPEIQEVAARPFLKWVGGKRSILSELLARMPKDYKNYCEPFIGGGALFFAAQPERAYLSDVNYQLVLAFLAVKHEVEGVIANLKIHAARHSKEYYLRARERLGKEKEQAKIGALLIYLNKTCYNGLYRVNKAGEFNVPIGSYDDPAILDEDNLRAVSGALQSAEIKQHEFWQAKVETGNFYYLDPPYHKVYDSYAAGRFGDGDHKRLAAFCRELDKAGCPFMVSNSDTPLIRSLYGKFKIEQVMASRFVSCKPTQRGKETELVIRNYE